MSEDGPATAGQKPSLLGTHPPYPPCLLCQVWTLSLLVLLSGLSP
jgi:hypothetical protein